MTQPAGVAAPIATFFAAVGFAALAICGFGFTSLVTDTDVIAAPGLGQGAGIAAMLLAAGAFAGAEYGAVRRGRYPAAVWVMIATVAGYLAGIVLGGVLTGADAALALGAAGTFSLSWFALVLAVTAAAASWAGIALGRTRARRPEWPWERSDEDE
ncbi:hypothetical protein [Microbacterium sp. 11MF]|uniref:hypothetical protein n=1 Tax=Microbacterium sp. 11MF TaxID=1169146 RepID=UPI00035D00BE|nr:hypothetical protein [Microbacterium sp. 11MF]